MNFALRHCIIHSTKKNPFNVSAQTRNSGSSLNNRSKFEDNSSMHALVQRQLETCTSSNTRIYPTFLPSAFFSLSEHSKPSFPCSRSVTSTFSGSHKRYRTLSHQIRYLHAQRESSGESNFEAVSLSEIKRFLRKNEIPFEDGHTCLHVDCLFCNREHQRRRKLLLWDGGKLYINKTTGYFVCINCRLAGSWKNLQDLVLLFKSGQSFTKASINLLKPEEITAKTMAKLNELEKSTTEIAALDEDNWGEISEKLGLQVLQKSVLEAYGGRYNFETEQIYLPVFGIDKKCIGYTLLGISQKTGKLEETNVPKTCNELFGWKKLMDSFSATSKNRKIILVTSALDVLSVANSTSHMCLSLPPRSTHLPQEYLPKLEHFSEIIIWLGNSLQCWETAKTFGRKLGEKRCRLVRPEEHHFSPFRALQNKVELNTIYNAAQIMEHKAITTFSKLREDVFSEFNNCEQVAGVKWVRYPYLNKLMKGHRRGELTILTGSTGCGKTTFMSEYSLDLCVQGVNTLWGSFEIRNVRLAKTMLTQFAEKNLEDNLNEYDKWADQFEQLPLYFMTFHGQQNIKAVLDAMTHAAYVYDIAHVIVDNLQFMLGVSESTSGHLDRFWKQDLIVAMFRKFATVNNCHVSLVMHPRKEETNIELSNNSIFGGAKASQEADNILILQDKRLTSPRGKKFLQISKNRFSGDLGMFALEFDKDSLSFSGKKKRALAAAVKQPTVLSNPNESEGDAIKESASDSDFIEEIE